MTDYELSKIADTVDEDAISIADFELAELLQDNAASFKESYFDFYDDIKRTPNDDW